MNISDLYSGLRPFASDEEIISTVKRSKYYDSKAEDVSSAKKIQLFDTSKQRTYLISTGKRIYKVLDDRRADRPKLMWSRKIEDVFSENTLKGRLIEKSERSYNLVFDSLPNRMNLVSKKLFENIELEEAIARLSEVND